MRPLAFAVLVALTACESNENVLQTHVVWMDWPAEVQANDPFRTRLVVWQPCAIIRGFVPSVTAGEASVTVAPYFLVDKDPIYCVDGGYTSDFTVNVPLDTAGMVPGLPTQRLYEMRAAAALYACAACDLLNTAPWTFFGYVAVGIVPPPSTPVRNAAGSVFAQRDSVGCTRIRPSGLGPSAAIVIENPPDTSAQWSSFISGSIYRPAAPVCGATTVFRFVYPPD